MKRPWIALLCLLLTSCVHPAQRRMGGAFGPYPVGAPNVSLNTVGVTGAGTLVMFPPLNGEVPAQFTWQVKIAGGTATAITTNFECTLDGTTFGQWDQSTSTTGEIRSVVNKPAAGCRCNIAVYTPNGTTATCQFVPRY